MKFTVIESKSENIQRKFIRNLFLTYILSVSLERSFLYEENVESIKEYIFTLIVIIIFVAIAVFIYHNYQKDKESSLISEGTSVNFNNKEINVYTEGSGEDTYVFMSGSGIAAPVYELKGLYSKFAKKIRLQSLKELDMDTVMFFTMIGILIQYWNKAGNH